MTPKFTPIETPKGWMVSIPAAMTSAGRRKRKYFPAKTAAEKFAANLRKSYNSGLRSSMISVALAHQAIEAARILEGSGVSLVESARLTVAKIATSQSKETFGDRYNRAMLTGEMRWSDRYRTDMDRLPRWAPSLMPLACGMIDRAKIEEALQHNGPLSRSTIDMRARYVMAVLGFRERHQKSSVIHILTDDQRKAVFAASKRPVERRAVALLMYAGIRPDAETGEISRLDWEYVRGDEIYIPKHVSKTKTDRIIPILPVLARKLKGRPKSGPVIPAGWKKTWQRIRKEAGISDLQDVLRHTFASHFLAAYGEEAAKRAMGHAAGSTTLFRHYRRAVSEKDGIAFFE